MIITILKRIPAIIFTFSLLHQLLTVWKETGLCRVRIIIIFISSLISLFFKPKCLHVAIINKTWIGRIGTYRTLCFMKYTSVQPCKFVLPSELFYCCLYFTESSSIYKSFEFFVVFFFAVEMQSNLWNTLLFLESKIFRDIVYWISYVWSILCFPLATWTLIKCLRGHTCLHICQT